MEINRFSGSGPFLTAFLAGGRFGMRTAKLCPIASYAWSMPGCDDPSRLRERLRYRSIDIVGLGATRRGPS
jgi:hypothetical protein